MSFHASSGTLTFLFADLESSTRLWEQHGGAMKTAMQQHDAILRAAVEEANGDVVKTTGDGVMAVFRSACDAVSAALAAERALAAQEWGSTGPLRARIGLHSGEAELREGDYFGPPVYRAARIMAAAHGGQVVMSGLTATLAREGGLPPDAELRDLGEHRLKDLLQPERIFELVHPDLRADFPPLVTLSRRPHNLPVQTSELIGRENELRAVRDQLESPHVRLLTLSGPGGIGKTRLALQAAAEQLDRFTDGVFFVDLSGARDADALLSQIVRAARLPAAGDRPLLDVVRAHLEASETLLVLDNFEQVIAAAAVVAELLQHCPRVKVLVTSREALRVRGEQLLPIPPLELPDASTGTVSAASISEYAAVRLFLDRARRARPEFVLSDDNAAAVAAICSRLDGLPLAIELAAARLNLFSPGELLNRLQRRLDVLRGGARDLPARQQTLRGTIEWSYELLSTDERLVFRLFSIFAGARVDAVEDVAARLPETAGVDALEALSSLIDKSLVRSVEHGGGQQLSMLETIREYAAGELERDSGLAGAARRAHAEYYGDRATAHRAGLDGAKRQATLDELSVEIGNLRASWAYWLAEGELGRLQPLFDVLWFVYEARGWYHDAIALATELLEALSRAPASASIDEELTLRMAVARGLLAVRGPTEDVEQVYRAALERADAVGELPRRLPVLRSLANFHLYRGEIDKVKPLGEQLLELGERENDSRMLLEGHFLVGIGVGFMGEPAKAQEHLARTTALFDPQRHGPARLRLGPSPGVTAYTTSALLYWLTGYPDSADRQAANALDLAKRLDHPYTLAYAHFHVGLLNVFARRFATAAEHAAGVLRIAEERDYAIWRALGLVLQAVPLAHSGAPADALASADRGLALYQTLRTPPIFWPLILELYADVNAMGGNYARATGLLDEALAMTNDEDINVPYGMLTKADVLAMSGDVAAAREAYRRAFGLAQKLGTLTAQLRAAEGLVRLAPPAPTAEDLDRLEQSLDQFREGIDSVELGEARALAASLRMD